MLHFLLLLFCASRGSGMTDKTQQNKYVIGGQDTNITEVPYQAAVYMGGQFICGATIVSERHLLTAAHCIKEGNEYWVRVGSSFRNKGGVKHKIKKMKAHPLHLYRVSDYDVGYLEVEDPIEFNAEVQPIPVTNVEPKGGEVAKISGFGRNDSKELPEQLQSAELLVLDRQKCNFIYQGIISSRMICTISKDCKSCPYKGDSGGPIVVNGMVVGAVSWGKTVLPCNSPSVYANFADPEIQRFIKENTGL